MNEKKSMTENNLEERDTVEAPLTATSLQWPLFWQTVHTLTLVFNQAQGFKTPSKSATFFCPQGGRRGEVHLYYKKIGILTK